jgi:hypothetical protein
MPIPQLFEAFIHHELPTERAPVAADRLVDDMKRCHEIKRQYNLTRYEEEERRDEALRENFLEASGWSAIEWDRKRERIFFVHDHADPDGLACCLIDAMDVDAMEDEDFEREESRILRRFEQGSRRSVFAELAAEDPVRDQFEKVGTVTEPVPADVYLGPEDDEEL